MNSAGRHLDFLADCLRVDRDEAGDRRIRNLAAMRGFDWAAVIGLANRHQLAPALWVALVTRRLMQPVPAPLRAFLERTPPAGAVGRLPALYLEDRYAANRKRNEALRAELIGIVGALNEAGIEPVILKGGAMLLEPAGLDPATRVMRDLDLLIPRSSLDDAVSALAGLGFAEIETGMPPAHHHPPLLRDGGPASVELHWDLLAPQARAMLPTAAALRATRPCPADGAVARILAPTERLLHNLLHAQVVDRAHRRHQFKLRDLHEFSLLAQRFGTSIDWDSMAGRLRPQDGEHWLEAYLWMAQRLLGLAWPLAAPSSGRARRHYTYCRMKLALPEPLRRADSILDQLAIGFSRAMIVERYGPILGVGSLWRTRWRHLRNLRRKYRGKLAERLRGPTPGQP